MGLAVVEFGGEVAQRARREMEIQFGAAGDYFREVNVSQLGKSHPEVTKAERFAAGAVEFGKVPVGGGGEVVQAGRGCLLYTSDAADD